MKSYCLLAKYYDSLMNHIDYSKAAGFYLDAARHFGWRGARILDLACGTGSIKLELLKKGYAVDGIDISPDMLAVADKKIYEAGFVPNLICRDMRDFRTAKSYDLIICAFDSLNYLLKETDLEMVFSQVYQSLNEDGLFIFDVHSEYKLKEILGHRTFIHVSDENCYIWQNKYKYKTSICNMKLDIFIRKSNRLYERIEEYHRERFYSPQTLESLLAAQGLQVLGIFGDMKLKKPALRTERLYFVARKQPQPQE